MFNKVNYLQEVRLAAEITLGSGRTQQEAGSAQL